MNKCEQELTQSYESLHALGIGFQTDKVYAHHYDAMYARYLNHYRGKNLTLLEIGLGCGMPRGVGASASMWRAYFGPKANIHIIEFDKPCGKKWLATNGSKVNKTCLVEITNKNTIALLIQF